jgi:hypothetical protein
MRPAVQINLLTLPGFYDIALRDFGLLLGALALGRLSHRYAAKGQYTTIQGNL